MLARALFSLVVMVFMLGAALSQEQSRRFCARLYDPYGCAEVERTLPPNILQLLSTYPCGGEGLGSAVYSMVSSRPAVAASMIAIANRANPEQMVAIVRGLLRALEELSKSAPECSASCASWLGDVTDTRPWHIVTDRGFAHGDDGKCDPAIEPPPVRNFGQSCGGPIRAAMQCATPPVDSALAAIARQIYAISSEPIAGRCNAPIYEGTRVFSGWTVPSGLPVSRN